VVGDELGYGSCFVQDVISGFIYCHASSLSNNVSMLIRIHSVFEYSATLMSVDDDTMESSYILFHFIQEDLQTK